MKMRKGFTLVELLIVIVIIGILAAAMLLSSGSATASAEASNIVSNLRTTKAALLMWYADNMDAVTATALPAALTNLPVALAKYLDNPSNVAGVTVLQPTTGDFNGKWLVGYSVSLDDVKEKLAGRAQKTGLLGSGAVGTEPDSGDYFTKADAVVWMIAR